MRPARCSRVVALVASLAGMAAMAPAIAQQPAPNPREWLRSGPMVGPAERTETTVWLQTTRPARVQVRFWPEGDPSKGARLSAEVETAAAGDHIARLPLTGLAFGTRYAYEVYLDGLRVDLPYPAGFQTQAMWEHRTPPPPLRIALGSCAYVNDPPYDRPEETYGGAYEIFGAIAAQKPDLMLWLGDNVYYREADWTGESAMRYRYAHTRALRELQPLLAAAHHYATWDDHDYGPNNSDRTFRGREESLRVFRDYWPNPSFGTLEVPGVFTRFTWSDVEVFLLDDRFHRSPNAMPESPDKRMYGREQLRWLLEGLASSEATFKVVVGGNQFLNHHEHEDLGDFPAEKEELLGFLAASGIGGVVLVSGDRHHTELLKLDRPGLYPLYEFTSSPLTSGGSKIEEEADNPLRIPGTWVTDGTRNFGLIEVTGPEDDRVLTLRTLDAAGQELWRRQIRRSELGRVEEE